VGIVIRTTQEDVRSLKNKGLAKVQEKLSNSGVRKQEKLDAVMKESQPVSWR
jgi:hypothetical protein